MENVESSERFGVSNGVPAGVTVVLENGWAPSTMGFNFCALVTSGGVDCWGYGEYGELGNGVGGNSGYPLAVSFP